MDSPVSAGERGLGAFLTGIGDEEKQSQRDKLFTVDESAIKRAAEQLRDDLTRGDCVGRAVLGPRDAKITEKAERGWDLIDLSQID